MGQAKRKLTRSKRLTAFIKFRIKSAEKTSVLQGGECFGLRILLHLHIKFKTKFLFLRRLHHCPAGAVWLLKYCDLARRLEFVFGQSTEPLRNPRCGDQRVVGPQEYPLSDAVQTLLCRLG